MRLTGLWWWIDRWRKSTAFTSMSLEEQGAYRNLLDEAALRGGAIPDNDEIFARACGDARRWKKVKPACMARFVKRDDGWHNETMDGVIAESRKRSDKQRDYRNRNGNGSGNASSNEPGNDPPPPDLLTPPQRSAGGRAPGRSRGLVESPLAHGECLAHGPICLRPRVVDRLNLRGLFRGDEAALRAWARKTCERWNDRVDAGAQLYTADEFEFWRKEYGRDFAAQADDLRQPTGPHVDGANETRKYLDEMRKAAGQ